MDISFLKTLNPTLSLAETKSLFYNKFYYRITIRAPGIRRHIYYKGDASILSNLHIKTLDWQIDYKLNNSIYKIILNKLGIKFRIESPNINFYLQTEQDLNYIISLFVKSKRTDHIIEICAPSKDNINVLDKDTIIVKKIPVRYQYKVTVKGGIGTDEYVRSRQRLSNYLYNLGTEVYSRNLNLISDVRYYYNSTYFYCTDDKIVLLLQLSYPDLIGKTFKVVKV